MTKQEFIARQRALNDISTTKALVWIVVFFATLIGGAVLAGYVERRPELTWLGPVLGVSFGVIMLGCFALALWFVIRSQKRHGHRCPTCRKSLMGCTAQIAIATGNCGFCGVNVFETEPPP